MAAIVRATPIGIAALCALAGILAGEARAGETTHRTALIQSTTVEREDGFVEVYQSVRHPSGSVTPVQNRMRMRLPQGSRVRFGRFEQCLLAKLQAFGANGCPRRSKVGHGRVSGSYLQDQVRGTFRLYNGERVGNRRSLLVYVEPERGPTIAHVAKWVGRKLDFQLALFSPYQAEPALSNFEFAFRSRFLDSPCGGRWTVTGFFVDGTSAASGAATACP
jgi:hypothetical protein